MRFENSEYYKNLKHYKLETTYGDFYFCDNFFIGEIFEGIHFEWDMVDYLMNEVRDFYGKDAKLGYVSNRINSYSLDPQSWEKVYKKYGIIQFSAIIAYNNFTLMNAKLEKQFSSKKIKRCTSLTEAMDWVSSMKELV
ncbi:hypothetical protein [Flavivirga jejuensis]|uniref:STAS/SEC14 domain-containing protein n=1 Tax=Flavivirga jejuensis TaxID=870487 RepID=A0ABT8WSI0_9FLAO|nr:hypothetical protein [Flavivirga jejuensis]MDO5976064.1 hypothetical protein [Flavivirga jejuensis]